MARVRKTQVKEETATEAQIAAAEVALAEIAVKVEEETPNEFPEIVAEGDAFRCTSCNKVLRTQYKEHWRQHTYTCRYKTAVRVWKADYESETGEKISLATAELKYDHEREMRSFIF